MGDAERWWAITSGVIGLACYAGGSLLARLPSADAMLDDVVSVLRARRTSILAGSILSVSGAALLLWPVAAVATDGGGAVWRSLALLSVALWVLGFALLSGAATVVAAVAWRGDPGEAGRPAMRLLLDAAHLAVWAVSGPLGAFATGATTVVAVQAERAGPALIVLAVVKAATVVVEVAGTGRTEGWNAGGWAAGVSGYVTVAWFAVLVVMLA